jgi:Epoxide hydrolase N terminus
MEVGPYTVHIPQALLDDLHARLTHTRWPDEIPATGWQYGAELKYMMDLVDYWRTRFDWRAQERAINAFSHFRAIVDGVSIHFIHEKGRGPAPIPIIITHGWPGSFFLPDSAMTSRHHRPPVRPWWSVADACRDLRSERRTTEGPPPSRSRPGEIRPVSISRRRPPLLSRRSRWWCADYARIPGCFCVPSPWSRRCNS